MNALYNNMCTIQWINERLREFNYNSYMFVLIIVIHYYTYMLRMITV